MKCFVQSWIGTALLGCAALIVSAQSTEPTSKPTPAPTTFPTTLPTTFPTTFPASAPTTQPSTKPTTNAVAAEPPPPPPPPPLTGIPEGTFLPDREGRLLRIKGSRQIEFVFEKDGKDVEVPLLSNLELMRLENAVAETGWSAKFRISGRVTEYAGKNYLLIDHAIRAEDPTTQPVEIPTDPHHPM